MRAVASCLCKQNFNSWRNNKIVHCGGYVNARPQTHQTVLEAKPYLLEGRLPTIATNMELGMRFLML